MYIFIAIVISILLLHYLYNKYLQSKEQEERIRSLALLSVSKTELFLPLTDREVEVVWVASDMAESKHKQASETWRIECVAPYFCNLPNGETVPDCFFMYTVIKGTEDRMDQQYVAPLIWFEHIFGNTINWGDSKNYEFYYKFIGSEMKEV